MIQSNFSGLCAAFERVARPKRDSEQSACVMLLSLIFLFLPALHPSEGWLNAGSFMPVSFLILPGVLLLLVHRLWHFQARFYLGASFCGTVAWAALVSPINLIFALPFALSAISVCFACQLLGVLSTDSSAPATESRSAATSSLLCFARMAVQFMLVLCLVLILRDLLGWVLALRLTLLIPAFITIRLLFSKQMSVTHAGKHSTQNEEVAHHTGLLLVSMLFVSATVLTVLHYLEAVLIQFQLQPFVLFTELALFALAPLLLIPLSKRYSGHLFGLGAIVMLLFSVFSHVLERFSFLTFLLLSLSAGLAISAYLVSMQATLQSEEAKTRGQTLRALIICCAFAAVIALLGCQFFGVVSVSRFAPVLLFMALISSFFIGHERKSA